MGGDMGSALLIMMLGMAGVGIFLTILVLVMLAVAWISRTRAARRRDPAAPTPAMAAGTDLALVAVVQAVVAAYESEQQEPMATEGIG
jgi:Na+-transporting methylmalonyl-CoA/oxaloacetate decarboxylase gamma subunit